jgi:L-cysteine S-thiosulfotransferase
MKRTLLRVAGLRMRAPSPQRGEGWGEGAPTERPEPPRSEWNSSGCRRSFSSRKRTPSPQRGEGWGEGVPTERPEPPHPSLSPLGRGRSEPRLRVLIFISALLVGAGIARADDIPLDQRRSDSDFVSTDTRAMQNDDTANPAMLVVLDGETLWNERTGATKQSCADCHGDAAKSMKGVAARYPAMVTEQDRPVDLEQRIVMSRLADQKAAALPFESKDLLALTAYIARQSRGMPVAVKDDAQAKPFIAAGRAIFERRQGQLDLSCAQCHDDNWGKKLAGNPVPQAMATGYPIYRLEWQEVGSLQRRLRNCMSGMRAEPYDFGAPELVDLEYFLMWRARGMTIESPAVRP